MTKRGEQIQHIASDQAQAFASTDHHHQADWLRDAFRGTGVTWESLRELFLCNQLEDAARAGENRPRILTVKKTGIEHLAEATFIAWANGRRSSARLVAGPRLKSRPYNTKGGQYTGYARSAERGYLRLNPIEATFSYSSEITQDESGNEFTTQRYTRTEYSRHTVGSDRRGDFAVAETGLVLLTVTNGKDMGQRYGTLIRKTLEGREYRTTLAFDANGVYKGLAA